MDVHKASIFHNDVKYCYSSPHDFTINSLLLPSKMKNMRLTIHQIGIKTIQFTDPCSTSINYPCSTTNYCGDIKSIHEVS